MDVRAQFLQAFDRAWPESIASGSPMETITVDHHLGEMVTDLNKVLGERGYRIVDWDVSSDELSFHLEQEMISKSEAEARAKRVRTLEEEETRRLGEQLALETSKLRNNIVRSFTSAYNQAWTRALARDQSTFEVTFHYTDRSDLLREIFESLSQQLAERGHRLDTYERTGSFVKVLICERSDTV